MRVFPARLAIVLLLASRAWALDITSCGTSVPSRVVGVLQADLVCSDTTALLLGLRSTLDMNGHTLTVSGHGVYCGGSCRIVSALATPGTIVGSSGPFSIGIWGLDDSSIRVENVIVHGFHLGIFGYGIRVRAVDVVVFDNDVGIGGHDHGVKSLRADHVTATGNGIGIFVTNNVRARDSSVTDNATTGIDAGFRLSGKNLTVTNNGAVGIDTSLGYGDRWGAIVVKDSTVTGHTTDLVAGRRPFLRNSSCDTSEHRQGFASFGTWGVCASD
jgi:hypothetical protein